MSQYFVEKRDATGGTRYPLAVIEAERTPDDQLRVLAPPDYPVTLVPAPEWAPCPGPARYLAAADADALHRQLYA